MVVKIFHKVQNQQIFPGSFLTYIENWYNSMLSLCFASCFISRRRRRVRRRRKVQNVDTRSRDPTLAAQSLLRQQLEEHDGQRDIYEQDQHHKLLS